MNTELLNKISDKKLTRITTKEIDEAAQILSDSVNEIESLPTEEEKITQLNLRFGFLENSILHLAAKFADVTSTEKILKIADGNSEIINARDTGLFTPLHFVAHSGDPMVAKLLLEAGAENNPQASTEHRRWTPIHYAAQFGHASVIEELINSGVDKETRTGFGLTPLVVGAEFGQINVVQLMLGLGVNKNAQTIEDNYKMNALHYAAVGNFCDLAKLLLRSGIDRNQTTSLNLSALDLAIQSDHSEMVALLLYWGIGDMDSALNLATENKSIASLEKIKNYLNARKNFFDAGWVKKSAPELISALKKCNRENLSSTNISPSITAPFNICGILSLKHQTGFFSKSDETFVQFCIANKMMDVVAALRAAEQMIPKS